MSQTSSHVHNNFHNIARRISALGMGSVAHFTLQAFRPLALPTAQLLWVAQPILAVFWQPQRVADWAQFLEEPGSIDILLTELESEG